MLPKCKIYADHLMVRLILIENEIRNFLPLQQGLMVIFPPCIMINNDILNNNLTRNFE